MSQRNRLETGGRLIDRSKPLIFKFDGRAYQGFQGDTLASALLANGVKLMGRSYKYHRPRGPVASGAEEPNALINLETGAKLTPNQRATQIPLYEGLQARSQNRWPSLYWDVGAVNGWMSKLLPAGFYYKTFIHPRFAWKHVFEPAIRRAAGLGAAPKEEDPDAYEHFYFHCDVLVVGAGPAGLAAARAAGEAGAKTLLVEQTDRFGGRLLVDDCEIDGQAGADWAAAQVEALGAMDRVTVRKNTIAAAVYDHGYCVLQETCETEGAPRQRLWRVRAKRVVIAAGAIERPIAFSQNDVPGVMLASAVRDYARLWGAAPGKKTVVFATNDDAYRTALALDEADSEVIAVLDARPDPRGALPEAVRARGIDVRPLTGISKVVGGAGGVRAVELVALRPSGRPGGRAEKLICDCVAMSGGWSPAAHLYSHSGGKLFWDDALHCYRPDPLNGPKGHDGEIFARCAGSANGAFETGEVLADGAEAGAAAALACGFEAPQDMPALEVEAPTEEPLTALWFTPSFGKGAFGAKHFLDFQHDVTAADIELAAREGYESVEHAKRYTTLGMATDQGKLSNVNGHAILADALNKSIPAVGTTTFRPPYTPISFGAIAGRKAKALFKPIRRTPMHGWLAERGADWEPVGDWRRPYRLKQGEETRQQSILREIKGVREAVGLLDASTLGKLLVKGPDAGKFLDLLYTNVMSSLKVGRCRYGLMCNDNGFLFDDGVVARLSEDSFLCHTTSGGADRVHGWMEEWLQTEWWDLKVYVANVSEQWAQFALAGPQAREVLKAAGATFPLANEDFKFFDWVEGEVGGIPVRVFRISFTGELSYELAVPANMAATLWEKLTAVGEDYGMVIHGTEALHVLRAEKGFIVVGDETDGTVTPLDLNMGWAVSKKKADFLGKRAMARSYLAGSNRKQLVGLLTEDPAVVLPDGAYAAADPEAPKPMKMIGHVTSSYHSPTLERSIAMALVENGLSRMGETIHFPLDDKTIVKAEIVDPVFYDKEGERQNV